MQVKIELKEERVIRYKPYRVPYHHEQEMKKIIQELADNNIIEISESEFASPAILVKKKDESFRMCVDYRKLNEITKRECFPMPNIEEQLNAMAGAENFINLDLMSGYYQVQIDPHSRHYTAFVTSHGHYQFKRMPFGLTNAPSVFMRLMKIIMEKINDPHVFNYMDDIIIASKSMSDGFKSLQNVLAVMREVNLTLNIKKCFFFSDTVTYLGHRIGKYGIKPGQQKIDTISCYPEPKTIKEVRQFLGLTSYFRRFIPLYAKIALPLNRLLRKDVEFVWEKAEVDAFVKLKEYLTTEPVLDLYDPVANHEVHTDACSLGIAGVLMQIKGDNSPKAVSYFSRATTAQEQKYHSYELEALAVVESLERFRYYLLGKGFRVITDCNSLKQTHEKRAIVPRIARWWLRIQEFDFNLDFRPGTQMNHVDAISRATTIEEDGVEEVGEKIMVIGVSSSDWVALLQLQDLKLNEIKEELECTTTNSKTKKNYENQYEVKGGRLYKKTSAGLKFVVPYGMRWQIIKFAHNDIGHPGEDRTLEAVRKIYWFPRMRSVVKKYINSCMECLHNKSYKDENRREMFVREIQPIPFHTVHLDHLGPYTKSTKGKTHLIGMIDAFSKFIIVKAVRNTRTQYVIQMIDEVSQFFGLPSQIISDRGSAFTSTVFQEFCHENSIVHIQTAVRTPRGNGQIERYFRTIKAAIASMTERQDGRDWDRSLYAIQWGLNSLPHRITKNSPQKLLLGYEPKSILRNQLTAALHEDQSDDEESIPLSELRQKVGSEMNEIRKKSASKFNSNRILPDKYDVGDFVLIRCEHKSTGQPQKHLPRYKGPYVVERVLGKDRYEIVDPPNYKVSQKPFKSVYVADKMRPWCRLEDYKFGEDNDEPELYEVNSSDDAEL